MPERALRFQRFAKLRGRMVAPTCPFEVYPMTLFNRYLSRYEESREEVLTLQEYLELCKRTQRLRQRCRTVAEGHRRTGNGRYPPRPRLSRIFQNKVLKLYPAFEEFYGMEDAIEQIVSYLRHAAQGLEEKKQILYLLGPVGGGKSSLAERLKQLMERVSFYAIEGSPVFESPLGCSTR
jgi:serine protein kinase